MAENAIIKKQRISGVPKYMYVFKLVLVKMTIKDFYFYLFILPEIY